MAWQVNAGKHVSTVEGCHKTTVLFFTPAHSDVIEANDELGI